MLDLGVLRRALVAGYVPDEEERQYAMYAHLFGLFGLVLSGGILALAGPVVALSMAKRKGPFLLFHANQIFLFYAVYSVALLVTVVLVAFGGGCCMLIPLVNIIAGLGMMLFMCAVGVVAIAQFVYCIVVTLQARKGEWVVMPFVGRRVLDSEKPFLV